MDFEKLGLAIGSVVVGLAGIVAVFAAMVTNFNPIESGRSWLESNVPALNQLLGSL